jgi:hypothetical protein
MMNMLQLFKHLPRNLRWDVLSEFVGSHAVRKGKIMWKMVFDDMYQMVPRIRECYIYLYNRNYNAKTDVQLWSGSQLMFCEDTKFGEMSFGHQYTPLNDSDKLPPFEKHSYPSYEDTDKKKKTRRPTQKQKPLCLRLPSSEEEDGPAFQPKSPEPKSPDGHLPL